MGNFSFFNCGGKNILRSVTQDFYTPFMKLTKKNRETISKPHVSPILVFYSSLLHMMGELAGRGSVAVAVGLVTGDR